MDVHDRQTRSFNMSRIRGGNTKPELLVRRGCHRAGLRFRLHRKDLPGKPDLVFPRYRTVVFVHGCYWHSHGCTYGAVIPKTNTQFWQSKRADTVERDKRNIADLLDRGWRVVIVWECATKGIDSLDLVTIGKRLKIAVADNEARLQQIPARDTLRARTGSV